MNDFLIIVESKGKEKQLRRILKEIGASKFDVISTNGRLFDLSDGNCKIPENIRYIEVDVNKYKNKEIETKSKLFKDLYIATDLDTEGEKIAHDIIFISNNKSCRRVNLEFSSAENILNLMNDVIDISKNDVLAYSAKRIFDRILGYTYSGSNEKNKANNSEVIGRVLSPVLSQIKSQEQKTGSIIVKIKKDNESVNMIVSAKSMSKNDIESCAERLDSFTNLEIKLDQEIERTDISAFWTGKQAIINISASLNMPIKEVNNNLQELYESGMISYFRTDSCEINISDTETLAEIARYWGIDIDEKELIISRSKTSNSKVKNKELQQGGHGALIPLSNIINPFLSLHSLSNRDSVYSILLCHSLKVCKKPGIIKEKIYFPNLESGINKLFFNFIKQHKLDVKFLSRTIQQDERREPKPYYPEFIPNGINKGMKVISKNTSYFSLSNDLAVGITMYNLGVSRPSTFSYHATRISEKYIDNKGCINLHGVNCIKKCESEFYKLLKSETYYELESCFYNDDLSLNQRVTKAIEVISPSESKPTINEEKITTKIKSDIDSGEDLDFSFLTEKSKPLPAEMTRKRNSITDSDDNIVI